MFDNERDLISKAQNGDTFAYEALVRPHQAKLFRVITAVTTNREDAEDCLQEALVHAFRALATFRGDSSFSTWLYRIALNTTRNWLRAESRASSSRYADKLGAEPVSAPSDQLERSVLDAEAAAFLRAALAALPDHYREPLLLRHYEQMDYGQIAQVLRIPIGTVRSRLAQGRRLLAQRLDALGYPCPSSEATRK